MRSARLDLMSAVTIRPRRVRRVCWVLAPVVVAFFTVLAVALGVLSLGSALALAGVAAWLITRAWQMPPVLDLSVAVVAVRALGISRGVLGYCQRLASHDTALRAAADTRERLYRRLADAPAEVAMRLHSGDLEARIGASVDELSDVLVRAVLPIAVAAVLSLAAVTAIAVISPAAALVLAVCLVIAGVVAPWLAARAATAAENVAVQHHSGRDVAVMLAYSFLVWEEFRLRWTRPRPGRCRPAFSPSPGPPPGAAPGDPPPSQRLAPTGGGTGVVGARGHCQLVPTDAEVTK